MNGTTCEVLVKMVEALGWDTWEVQAGAMAWGWKGDGKPFGVIVPDEVDLGPAQAIYAEWLDAAAARNRTLSAGDLQRKKAAERAMLAELVRLGS